MKHDELQAADCCNDADMRQREPDMFIGKIPGRATPRMTSMAKVRSLVMIVWDNTPHHWRARQ